MQADRQEQREQHHGSLPDAGHVEHEVDDARP
jgi:hypothetical protein